MTAEKPIYLDNNATTAVDAGVLKAMLPWFSENFGNAASRSHVYGWEAAEAVNLARNQVAKALNCYAKEIIFTSGATEANNLMLKGFYEANSDQNPTIITSKTEHKSILETCISLQKKGVIIHFLEVNKNGEIDEDDLISKVNLQHKTLVSLMLANNETGLVQNFKKTLTFCKENNVVFHTDATQAFGKINIDLKHQNIDFLSLSAHKIYGPKGIGVLYLKSGMNINAQIHGGGHERSLRSGTLNVPGIVGLGKAAELSQQNLVNYQKHTSTLRDKLQNGLLQIPKTFVNCAEQLRLPNTLNICFEGIDGEKLLDLLTKIAVSTGSACTSASVEPSHVLKAMQLTDDQAHSSIRFSLGKYTTEHEIEFAIDYITKIIAKYRV